MHCQGLTGTIKKRRTREVVLTTKYVRDSFEVLSTFKFVEVVGLVPSPAVSHGSHPAIRDKTYIPKITMRALISAFALFVLWTIVPVVFAGQAAAPMFSDWLHAQKAGPSTRAKTQDASKAVHTKHLCLQETNQYNCRYFGCNQIDHYAGEPCSDVGVEHSPSCGDCTHGRFYQ